MGCRVPTCCWISRAVAHQKLLRSKVQSDTSSGCLAQFVVNTKMRCFQISESDLAALARACRSGRSPAASGHDMRLRRFLRGFLALNRATKAIWSIAGNASTHRCVTRLCWGRPPPPPSRPTRVGSPRIRKGKRPRKSGCAQESVLATTALEVPGVHVPRSGKPNVRYSCRI
jgi:hypothetical protein